MTFARGNERTASWVDAQSAAFAKANHRVRAVSASGGRVQKETSADLAIIRILNITFPKWEQSLSSQNGNSQPFAPSTLCASPSIRRAARSMVWAMLSTHAADASALSVTA